jgi:L-seryl-tRNA(Ser) seleniumtransferase
MAKIMDKQNGHEILKLLPSVDELISSLKGKDLISIHGRGAVVNAARNILDELRRKVNEKIAKTGPEDFSQEMILNRVEMRLKQRSVPSLHEAVNATGVILHTGLGRALLPQVAITEIDAAIKGYCTLAIDIETGQRDRREMHVKDLLCELTGAEDAAVVNNNAAATMLILNTLARGKEVIVSRGQLVEIGGSFRMPEVMEVSGAVMKEVGTTNKTHLKDYASAINERTGAILHVHQSNYRIIGFTEEPPLEELVELAEKYNLPVIDDLGSGALLNLKEFGLNPEPMVQESVKQGATTICFSGDKLIGGPQSGIIVGKTAFLERIRKNPLARALRVGKMTLAGLEATLKLFLNPEKLRKEHPLYRMLSLTPEELNLRVRRVIESLPGGIAKEAEFSVVDGSSQVGSGSAPAETLPSKLLSIRPLGTTTEDLSRSFRYHDPPIFARIHQESVLFDFRTVQPDEDKIVLAAITKILNKKAEP